MLFPARCGGTGLIHTVLLWDKVECWLSLLLFQVPSIPLQAMCRPAMRRTSLQLIGPSPSGVLSTPGSPSWSYTSRYMPSEGKLSSECTHAKYLLMQSGWTWTKVQMKTDISLSVNRSWAQCLLPYAFYFCWLSNMVMNMIWLVLWDREYVCCFYLLLICTQTKKEKIWKILKTKKMT